jgi:putative tryptophan/tyrosine transport system substrate-binding protein
VILVTHPRFFSFGRKAVSKESLRQKSAITRRVMIRILSCHFLITLLLVINSVPAISQTRAYRVGVLILGRQDRPHLTGLRDGLKEAGYIEGKNLSLEMPIRKTPDELRIIANTFVNERKNVIVTVGTVETRIAYEATREIPIVFMPTSDPVRSGFVKSLAHPGTNLTGLTYYVDLRESGKQLEIFKEIVPALRRVVLLIDAQAESPMDARSLTVARNVAARLRIKLIEKPVEALVQAEELVSSSSKDTTDGILISCASLFANLEKIAALSRQRLIPLHGCSSYHVTAYNALSSYAPDLYQIGRRAAWYVNRIARGARPQELPVETPRKFELAINLKTAGAIGIKIPPEVLQRADKVVK